MGFQGPPGHSKELSGEPASPVAHASLEPVRPMGCGKPKDGSLRSCALGIANSSQRAQLQPCHCPHFPTSYSWERSPAAKGPTAQGCPQPCTARAVLQLPQWAGERGHSKWDQAATTPCVPRIRAGTRPRGPRCRRPGQTGGSSRTPRYQPSHTQPGRRKHRFPPLRFPPERKQPERGDPGPLPTPGTCSRDSPGPLRWGTPGPRPAPPRRGSGTGLARSTRRHQRAAAPARVGPAPRARDLRARRRFPRAAARPHPPERATAAANGTTPAARPCPSQSRCRPHLVSLCAELEGRLLLLFGLTVHLPLRLAVVPPQQREAPSTAQQPPQPARERHRPADTNGTAPGRDGTGPPRAPAAGPAAAPGGPGRASPGAANRRARPGAELLPGAAGPPVRQRRGGGTAGPGCWKAGAPGATAGGVHRVPTTHDGAPARSATRARCGHRHQTPGLAAPPSLAPEGGSAGARPSLATQPGVVPGFCQHRGLCARL